MTLVIEYLEQNKMEKSTLKFVSRLLIGLLISFLFKDKPIIQTLIIIYVVIGSLVLLVMENKK